MRTKKPFSDRKEGQEEEKRKQLGGKGNSCYTTKREMSLNPVTTCTMGDGGWWDSDKQIHS